MAQIWYCCGLQYRPAAIAPIGLLAWEPPYAASAALKRKKKKKRKKERKRKQKVKSLDLMRNQTYYTVASKFTTKPKENKRSLKTNWCRSSLPGSVVNKSD